MKALLAKHGAKLTGSVRCTEIYQQNLGIDVLARVWDQETSHVLLIEDKKYTVQHSGQLERYFRGVVDGNSKLERVCRSSIHSIFLKTGNQSRSKDCQIEQATTYKVFSRSDFLDVLDKYPGNHPIVCDFREHLRWHEDDFDGFRGWRRDQDRNDWSWGAWEGFFRCLEASLDALIGGMFRTGEEGSWASGGTGAP